MRKMGTSMTLLSCSALALLVACAGREESAKDQVFEAPTPAVTAHEHEKAPAGRLAAMSPGKPKAPVGISIAPGTASLPIGVPVGLVLSLRTDAAAEGVELTLQGAPGVELLAPAAPMVLGPSKAGGQVEVPVQLILTGEGPARLSGLIILESAGQRQTRAVSMNVPAQAAANRAPRIPAAAATKPRLVTDSTGELIRSMEVEANVE